jgi:hypothetical protein
VLSSDPPVTEIDVLVSATNELRVGPAYCVADLIILNPSDWDYIRKQKNSFRFFLSATEPNLIARIDSIFGTRVVTTTTMPQGTGLVIDTRIAVLAWTCLGMEILSTNSIRTVGNTMRDPAGPSNVSRSACNIRKRFVLSAG